MPSSAWALSTLHRIDNPAYKGVWVAPDIDNPEYKHDDSLHLQKDLKYVGFELWQVKSGSIFDNIFVSDDLTAALKFAEDTWGKTKDGEKAMFDKIKEVRAMAICLLIAAWMGGWGVYYLGIGERAHGRGAAWQGQWGG